MSDKKDKEEKAKDAVVPTADKAVTPPDQPKPEKPTPPPEKDRTINIGNVSVPQGTTSHLKVKISESFTSQSVHIPISVINGAHPGPTMFIAAALHGDELNGVEVVRRLIYEVDLAQLHGALILMPVVNVLGFEASSRYLPDRRDLNRVFPGHATGAAAERIADKIFNIGLKCNYAIDLHTAATGRYNMPHVRADMDVPECRRMARAFGSEIIMDTPGVKHSMRCALTENKVPTILLEAGQSNRFEPAMVNVGLQGVMNVLYELGMMKGEKKEPAFRVIVKTTEWVRVDEGGLLDLRVKPRSLVTEGDVVAVVESPFGKEQETIKAPFTGMVVGVVTNPLVFPGGPVCHLVKIDKALEKVKAALALGNVPKAQPKPANDPKEKTEIKTPPAKETNRDHTDFSSAKN
jgi:predicted deacylase